MADEKNRCWECKWFFEELGALKGIHKYVPGGCDVGCCIVADASEKPIGLRYVWADGSCERWERRESDG